MKYFNYQKADVPFTAMVGNKQKVSGHTCSAVQFLDVERANISGILRWVGYTSLLLSTPNTHPHFWPHICASHLMPDWPSTDSSISQINTQRNVRKLGSSGEER